MDLDQWAGERYGRRTRLAAWLREHPEVGDVIVTERGKADPWPYSVIAAWLRDTYGVETSANTLQSWVSARA